MNEIPKMIFFRELEALLTLVPDELFPNMEARLSQKQALRRASEQLAEQEEADYAREQAKLKNKPKK
jgi:TyeA